MAGSGNRASHTGHGTNGHSGQNGRVQQPVPEHGYAPEPVGVQASAEGNGTTGGYAEDIPFPRPPERAMSRQQLTDLDIPTFIRRQMD